MLAIVQFVDLTWTSKINEARGNVGVFHRLRKEEHHIPIIMTAVYEYFRSAVKALQPIATNIPFNPFRQQMLTVALDRFELTQTYQKKQVSAFPSYRDTVHVSIQSQTEVIDKVVLFFQRRVTRFCRLYHIEPFNVSLCLREALANAIIHGNLEISSTLKEESWDEFEALVQEREAFSKFAKRRVFIRCQMTPKQLKFEIEDQGQGFDTSSLETSHLRSALEHGDPLKILPKSGRGVFIITSFMDRVFWNETGNCITMIKHFQPS